MNRADRFYVVLLSLAAIGILSAIAEVSYWIYFPMMFILLILSGVYIDGEE